MYEGHQPSTEVVLQSAYMIVLFGSFGTDKLFGKVGISSFCLRSKLINLMAHIIVPNFKR